MAELLHAPNGREALWTLFRYIAAVADDSIAQTLTAALEAAEAEVKDALMTIAEKWKAEGEAKGRAEGEAKGRAEGKAETLRKLLTLKFGALPEGTARGIASPSSIGGSNECLLPTRSTQ
jgi:flagellar biosynthesis/type III secretory pathway protein FliH